MYLSHAETTDELTDAAAKYTAYVICVKRIPGRDPVTDKPHTAIVLPAKQTRGIP